VRVGPIDHPPVASPDSYTAPAGASAPPLTVSAGNGVLADDTDTDGDTIMATVRTLPTHGVLVLQPDGSFTYTPAPGFTGTDTFTYVATDAGGLSSAPATVTIAVPPAPVAARDAYGTVEGTPLTVSVANGVLTNDSVAGGGALTSTVVTQPTHGTLSLQPNGSLTYTPAGGFSGTDTFTYSACTTANACSPATTVTITVTPADRPPVADDDRVTAGPDGSVTIPVLGNDHDPDETIAPGQVTIVTLPAHGTATVDADGKIRYVADGGFGGIDTLVYRICDAGGLCDDATVSVTVEGAVIEAPAPAAPSLPRTGVEAAREAGLAVLLIATGALLLGAGRRRRRSGALA
jgi:hypothetical protein